MDQIGHCLTALARSLDIYLYKRLYVEAGFRQAGGIKDPGRDSLISFVQPDVRELRKRAVSGWKLIKMRRFMENTMRNPKTFEFSSRNKPMSRNVLYAEDDRKMQGAYLLQGE